MPRGGKRENAGRKPTGQSPRKKISLHISAMPEEVEQIKKFALLEGKTVSDYVLSAVCDKKKQCTKIEFLRGEE